MADAEAALAALEVAAPTLVLTDFELPGLDGVALLAEVKARHPSTLRALMSGHLAAVSPAQRAALAPCHFFDKPLDDARALLALLGPPGERGPP